MFVIIPALGFYGILTGSDDIEDNKTGALIMLSVFMIIGLGGVFFGIRILFGLSPTTAETKASRTIPGSALPPLPKNLQAMANGYYRLKPKSSHRATFLLLLFVSLFWNGITWGVMIGQAVGAGSNEDPPPWWFMAIFGIVGVILIIVTIKAFLRWIIVGETHVDVSAFTAMPGQIIELLVSQPGNYAIDRLSVDFICQESATYKAGTDTQTKTEIVHTAPVCDHETLTAREGKVLTHQSAVIPADAMLSFKSSNNEICWFIRVKMVLPRRPDVEQTYPIRVVSPDIMKLEKHAHG